jgi:hypothetical protein
MPGSPGRRVHFLYLPKENATKRKGTPIHSVHPCTSPFGLYCVQCKLAFLPVCHRFACGKIPSLRNDLGGRRESAIFLPCEQRRACHPWRDSTFLFTPSLDFLSSRSACCDNAYRSCLTLPDTPQLAVHGQLTPEIIPPLSDSQGIGKSTTKSKSY